ncbi:MAG: hypothetical protein V7647_2120 [Acidobacteriota bacterium]|jgi:protein-S-isoprenylcysteine O-methyltransferase Ste14
MASPSRIYGAAQSTLFALFAAGYFLDRSPALFVSRSAAAAGLVLCAAGLLLMFSALRSLRDVVQVAPEPRAGGRLVTRGVYSRCRHPIYTAILILVAGLFLRKPTVPVGIGAALIVVFLATKVRFEEKLLLERYPEYRDYRNRTWGMLPWRRSGH